MLPQCCLTVCALLCCAQLIKLNAETKEECAELIRSGLSRVAAAEGYQRPRKSSPPSPVGETVVAARPRLKYGTNGGRVAAADSPPTGTSPPRGSDAVSASSLAPPHSGSIFCLTGRRTLRATLCATLQARTSAAVPPAERDFCVVLDGATLEHVLEGSVDSFLELVQKCSSVIVCRATPLQKSIIVK